MTTWSDDDEIASNRKRDRAAALGSAAAQTQKAGYGLGERFGADPEGGLLPWGVLRRRPRKQINLSHGDDLADDDEMPSMTTTTSGRCSDGGTDVARGSAEKKTTFSVGFRRLRVPRDVRNASAGDGCRASHRGHGKRAIKSSGSPPGCSEVSGGPRSPFSATVWEVPGGPGAGASGRRRALPNERKVAFGGGGYARSWG